MAASVQAHAVGAGNPARVRDRTLGAPQTNRLLLRSLQRACRHAPLSSVYRRTALAIGPCSAIAAAAAEPSPDDLLVIGPGVLGSYAGKLWLERCPNSTVIGQTNTDANHERLRKMGLHPSLRPQGDGPKYDNVLFSAPPSGSEDYVSEVKSALGRWTGNGSFVFTGSNSVLAATGDADEDSPLKPVGESGQTDRLLLSEMAVLECGGSVVRYVGLYHARRGAHTYFLKLGEVPRWGGYTVNLIHYEDAASMAVAVLAGQGDGPHKGRVFVGCDNHPVTFQDMMDATTASGKFEGSCTFTGQEGGDPGKRVSNDKTCKALKWKPKYTSFVSFMQGGAEDFYTTSGLF